MLKKPSLSFDAFASTSLVVVEKWFLVWQGVPAAEWGIWGWGWAVLARRPRGHHLPATQEGDGAGRHGETLCQKHFYFSSEKNKRRTFPQLVMGLATAALWQNMAPRGCHVPAPSAVPGPCGGRRSLFPESAWQGLPTGMREGLGQMRRQGKPWEKVLFVQGGMCAGVHTCRGRGGMEQGTPGCGEQLCAGTGTALWGSVLARAPRRGDPQGPSARWRGARSLRRGTEALPFPFMIWLGLWNTKGNKNGVNGV